MTRKLILTLLLLSVGANAWAKLEIEIVRGNKSAIPIAVVPFAWASSVPQPATGTAGIISDDLYRSGLFDPLAEADMVARPQGPTDIRYGDWKLLKTDYLVIGSVEDGSNGDYRFVYQLYDVNTQEQLLSRVLPVRPGDLRYGAHRIADDVYERIIGVPGAFATRIAYVAATGVGNELQFELVVADADGFNPQSIVSSPEPLMSPTWSPDGQNLAYVSFEKGNSAIWMQNVFTGGRRQISAYRGINGAPAFSPDGGKLAMALSRSGNPEIVVHDLNTGRFQQLTQHWAIDTEPAFSPDGRWIYFTSDRAGKPQIYKIGISGGQVQRVTFEGDYNARVTIAPDGKRLAMAHGNGNQYRIAILDSERNRLTVLSDGRLDESPSFAPNGSMILYASREGGRGVLSAVSADGSVRQRLVLSEGDVREPAWSPVIR